MTESSDNARDRDDELVEGIRSGIGDFVNRIELEVGGIIGQITDGLGGGADPDGEIAATIREQLQAFVNDVEARVLTELPRICKKG